jgi:uroporphyrinogen-III synthase
VARQLAAQLPALPASTVIVCIGPRTAFDARAAGLTVHSIADERTAESLVEALVDYAAGS